MARDEIGPSGSISASALKDYETCPRKWAWRKLDEIEGPANPSAEFGTLVHEQIEYWLKEGRPFDLTTEAGECALACLHLLPKPGTPGMKVEKSFTLAGWGHIFFGYKDVELSECIHGQNVGPAYRLPIVWDHKTTSDPQKWGLTEETIADDIQVALYAADSMVKTGSDTCQMFWNYIRTRKPYKAFPLKVMLDRKSIEPTLERIKTLADEMATWRDVGAKALDLPFSPGACEMYGGCPYKGRCNLTSEERIQAIMATVSEADKNKLVATLKARQGGAVNPPASTPAPGGWSLPEGGQMSPDGKMYWAPGMAGWEPVPSAPPGPPPLPSGGPPPLPEGGGETKRGPGRPAGSGNKPKNPRKALAKALRDAAEAIEAGALDSDDD